MEPGQDTTINYDIIPRFNEWDKYNTVRILEWIMEQKEKKFNFEDHQRGKFLYTHHHLIASQRKIDHLPCITTIGVDNQLIYICFENFNTPQDQQVIAWLTEEVHNMNQSEISRKNTATQLYNLKYDMKRKLKYMDYDL
jgi:hypothetical protein